MKGQTWNIREIKIRMCEYGRLKLKCLYIVLDKFTSYGRKSGAKAVSSSPRKHSFGSPPRRDAVRRNLAFTFPYSDGEKGLIFELVSWLTASNVSTCRN